VAAGGADSPNMLNTPRTHLRQKVGDCQAASLSARLASPKVPERKVHLLFEVHLHSPTFWRKSRLRNGDPHDDLHRHHVHSLSFAFPSGTREKPRNTTRQTALNGEEACLAPRRLEREVLSASPCDRTLQRAGGLRRSAHRVE